jgi:hypothetical protein
VGVFRASGIAYVRFAVTHPAHFRVMNMPAVLARTPPAVMKEVEAWQAQAHAQLAAAQAAGKLAALPIESIMMAAHCVVHGLALRLIDGRPPFQVNSADEATAMAEMVTDVFGVGILPRPEGPPATTTAATPATTTPTPRPPAPARR